MAGSFRSLDQKAGNHTGETTPCREEATWPQGHDRSADWRGGKDRLGSVGSAAAIPQFMPRSEATFPAAWALLLLRAVLAAHTDAADTRLHLAANGNFDANGDYLPGRVGFNLADVSSVRELGSLPSGVKGLAWVGRCGGVDADFLEAVRPYVGNAKLFGFYLMDDPDPTGRYLPLCPADNLKAESDWIHANIPRAKTFIVLMNMGSSKTPSFAGAYTPANSHVDLFGFSPYPCRTELNGCDYDMIDRYVAAAEASGVPKSSIVPVYQAFGGGGWVDDGGGRYVLPTVAEEQEILARWGALVPAVFDYAYSWGSQRADIALQDSSNLQAVFLRHNSAN